MAARGAVRARATVLAVVMAVLGTAAVACVPAPEPGTSPVPGGRFESLEPGEGSVRLVGWAWDRDTPEPLLVDVLVNGSWFGPFRSDRERPDVGAPGRLAIGFDVTVPASVGSATACVVAHNVPDGPVSLLGCRSTEVRAVAGPSGGTTTTVPTSTTTTSPTTSSTTTVPTTSSTSSTTTSSTTTVPTTSSTTSTTTTVPTTSSTTSTTTTTTVPTTTTTTVPSSGTVLSASVSVVSGTTDGLEVVVPGASVVTSVGAAVGDTSGLSVSASAAPSAPGSVAVRVGALSAPEGARTITFAVAGCATNPGGGACPSGDLVARTLDLRVTVTDPGPGVPDGFPLPAPEAWVARPDGTSVLPGHVDVFAAPPSPPADLAQLAAALGGAVVGAQRDLGLYRVRVPDVAAALPLLRAVAGVTDATETVSEPPGEVDTTPEDYRTLLANPFRPTVYHLRQSGVPSVWSAAAPAPRRAIGIVDNGIYEPHPDLEANIVSLDTPLPGFNVADRVAAWRSTDHGTHVAGIMCGADGNGGAVGVDPDCRLRAFDIGGVPISNADRMVAIDAWLTKRSDLRLVNVSLVLGGPHADNGCARVATRAERTAWDKVVARHAEVLFVVAAGNCGAKGKGIADALPQALALTRPNVITVSATDDVDTTGGALSLLSISARDGQVAAPGVLVQSSIHDPTDCDVRPDGTGGGYRTPDGARVNCAVPDNAVSGVPGVARRSGTSMAAPLVTGIASLVLDAHPTFTAAQVKRCLIAGATSDVTTINGTDGSVDPAVNEVDAVLAVRCESGYERQPAGPDGGNVNGTLNFPGAVSGDGRFVLVNTEATNAVAGDSSAVRKLLVWDRRTGTYRSQPPGVDGRRPNGASTGVSISADGLKVAFSSAASNLVAGDANGFVDAFVWDLDTDTYRRAPVATEGDIPLEPRISANGRSVVVTTRIPKLIPTSLDPALGKDVAVWNLPEDSVTQMPAGVDGFSPRNADGVGISADGTTVLISSDATNMTAGDPAGPDLYLWAPGATTYRRWPRTVPNSSFFPGAFLSADGSTVVVDTAARLLASDTDSRSEPYLWRIATDELVRAPAASDGSRPALAAAGISGNGASVLLSATSTATALTPGRGAFRNQMVVWDVASGTYDQQPLGFDRGEPLAQVVGGVPDAVARNGVISANGLVVAFESFASNLTRDCGCGLAVPNSQIYAWTGRATP